MEHKFFITTPIYYVNARPHIGHAYTTIAADVLARFHRSQGEDVFFLTGTDEHGLNIQKKAEDAKKDPQVFVDENSEAFKDYWKKLDIQYDNFIRTTDERHKKAVQKALQTLFDRGAIYKGEYEGHYCVACEQFRNEKDLVEGRCPDHDIVCEVVKEESYLLKMSGDVQKNLIKKLKSDDFKITPKKYKKEVLSFLESQELHDVSISRKNVAWGVELPFDKEHTTYVWADAFLNYLTGLGWDGAAQDSTGDSRFDLSLSANKSPKFLKVEPLTDFSRSNLDKFWPADVQLIGKDILRVHATIWPVMLMHLGIPLPGMIFVHGHILSRRRKMSKTLGNAISIDEMLEKFGVDGTRYLLMSAGKFGEDVDMTMERLTEKYNADLANGIGNLVSRVAKLLQNYSEKIEISDEIPKNDSRYAVKDFFDLNMSKIELSSALDKLWEVVREADRYIENNKPWELSKNNQDKFSAVMKKLILDLELIYVLIIPFMPETSGKIKKVLETKKTEILFQRIKH